MASEVPQDVKKVLGLQDYNPNESAESYILRLAERIKDEHAYKLSPASDIAKDENKWLSWATSAAVAPPLSLEDTKGEFLGADEIRKALSRIKERVKYPRGLLLLKGTYTCELIEEDYFLKNILEWSSTLEDSTWINGPAAMAKSLFLSWLETRKALEEGGCELAQRTGIDALLRVAFSARSYDISPHMIRKEQSVLLPVKPDLRVQLSSAKADTIVCKALLPDVQKKLYQLVVRQNARLYTALQCMQLSFADPVLLPTLFGEWNRFGEFFSACRQGAFYALSIQGQRDALGLPSCPIFGVIMASGVVRLLISFWSEDMLWPYYTEGDLTWDIRIPSKFMECYYFLCALKDELDDRFTDDMQIIMGKPPGEALSFTDLDARLNSWQVATKSRTSARRSGKGGSKNGNNRNNGGTRGNDEYDCNSGGGSKNRGQGVAGGPTAEDIDMAASHDEVSDDDVSSDTSSIDDRVGEASGASSATTEALVQGEATRKSRAVWRWMCGEPQWTTVL